MKRGVVLALVATASTARAEVPDDRVDPDTAQRLAIIGSAVPAAAIALGTLVELEGAHRPTQDVGFATAGIGALVGIVTPSLGDIYSHRYVTTGMGMRAAGVVAELIGLIRASNGDLGDCEPDDTSCHLKPATYGFLIGGAALYIGGMALDIAHAPAAARDWNRRHELQIVPTAMRSNGATTTGLAVSLTW